MKRWRMTGIVFLAVVAALLLVGGVASQDQCDTADALLKAKLYDKAQENYTDLLMTNSTLKCAKDGLNELRSEQARNLYELGQAYENASQEDAAKEAYIEALKNDPNSSEAREALAKVNGGSLGRYLTIANSFLITIGTIIAGILIFILLYYAIKLRIWPRWKERKKPRFNIQDFDTGATNLNISKGMAAMVEDRIKWFEKNKYHTQNQMLELDIVTNPIVPFEIPADIKSISPAAGFIAQLFEWLINLFSPDVITLSGCMEKPGVHGSGLTLILVDSSSSSGKIIGSQTLWQDEYWPVMQQDIKEIDPESMQQDIKEIDPESYYSLAEPAAIWAFFQLQAFCEQKAARFTIMSPIKSPTTSFTILNTGDWQSYAYFRAGVNLMNLKGKPNEQKKIEQKKMYLKALERDPDNVGALLNLGHSDREAKEFNRAIARLGRVKDIIKPYMDDYFVWFMASYKLIITYYEQSNYEKREKDTEMKEAKNLIDKIREEVYKPQKYLFSWDNIPRSDKEILIDFLNQHFGIEWVKPETVEIEKIDGGNTIKISAEKNFLLLKLNAEKTKVNLRIDDSITDELIVKVENSKLNIYLQKDETLMEFLNSFRPKAEILYAFIRADNGMIKEDDDQGIKDIKKDLMKLPSASQYNLACYYSIKGEKLEKLDEKAARIEAYKNALDCLNYALESGNLVTNAKDDISLKGVRESEESEDDSTEKQQRKTFAEKFAELIKNYSPAPTQEVPENLPLAGLTIIQEIYARQLKEQGIVSFCDLIKMTNTHSAREALATKLGISVNLLYLWAHLADMMSIVKDIKQVNLLEAAGIGSLDALKRVSDSCELANLLNQINKALSLVKQLPSMETVQQWVQEAKKTKPMVM